MNLISKLPQRSTRSQSLYKSYDLIHKMQMKTKIVKTIRYGINLFFTYSENIHLDHLSYIGWWKMYVIKLKGAIVDATRS